MSARCPACGSTELREIAYGFPGPEALDDACSGRIELGGCFVGPDMPTHRCVRCEHAFCAAPPERPLRERRRK